MYISNLNSTYKTLSNNQSAQKIKIHCCNLQVLLSGARHFLLEIIGLSGDDDCEQKAPQNPWGAPGAPLNTVVFVAFYPLPQSRIITQTTPWAKVCVCCKVNEISAWHLGFSLCRGLGEGECLALVAREVQFIWLSSPCSRGWEMEAPDIPASELHSLQYAIMPPLKVNRRFVCEKYSCKIFCSWKDNTIPCLLLGCTILIMSGNLSYFIFHIYLWNKLLANRTLFQII